MAVATELRVKVDTKVVSYGRFSAVGATVFTDPTTVKVRVLDPAGNVAEFEYGTDLNVIRDAAGEYHVEYMLDAAGRWFFQWRGEDGGPVVVEEDSVFVEPVAAGPVTP